MLFRDNSLPLFGNQERYFGPIEARAREVAKFYPGWIMRLYFFANDSDSNKQLCDLWCHYDHLDLCNVTDTPKPLGNLLALQPDGELTGCLKVNGQIETIMSHFFVDFHLTKIVTKNQFLLK